MSGGLGCGSIVALARNEAERRRRSACANTLFVDSADAADTSMARFAHLNPFHAHQDLCIPVPGTSLRSRSVEAVWQGLKLIGGATDLAMLQEAPRKRPSDAERRASRSYRYADSCFRYGPCSVDLVTARLVIYIPAYLHLLDHVLDSAVNDEIDAAVKGGGRVVFYDWDSNVDVFDGRSSYAHSGLLAAWYGGRIASLAEAARRWLEARAPDLSGVPDTWPVRRR